MKPFDTKGEYTPEEVKAELAGVDGTRQLSYRYERLDKTNKYIEDIDYVQSCTIENNALADIKRTAKLDILDTGSINYLQDRIKPYIRLAMPEDITYDDVQSAYSPDIWWKLDEPVSVLPTFTTPVTIPNDLQYTDNTNAYVGSVGNRYTVSFQKGSGTVRQEARIKVKVSDAAALRFEFMAQNASAGAVDINAVVRYSPLDGAATAGTSFLYAAYFTGAYYSLGATQALPKKDDYYYIYLYANTSTALQTVIVTVKKVDRIEDSSHNSRVGTMQGWAMQQPALTGGGTSARANSQGYIEANNLDLQHDRALVLNSWVKINPTSLSSFWAYTETYVATHNYLWEGTFKLECFSEDGVFVASLYVRDNLYRGVISIPLADVIGERKMITFVYQPDAGRLEFWLDGKKVGNLVDAGGMTVADSAGRFAEGTVETIEIESYADGDIYLDDIATYIRPVPDSMIADLYSRGIAATSGKRSGYVEWPQGVFLLSSPSRKLVNGNQVVRSVEGYDQLVVLKEDSFDYRYAVAAGGKYTDAIKTVLRSSNSALPITLQDSIWSTYNGAKILSDGSATFATSMTSAGVSTEDGSISFRGMTMASKVTGTSDGYFLMYGRFGGLDYGFFRSASGNLQAVHEGTTVKTATYDSTAHKYWRFRVTEDLMYWDTSANGTTWTNFIGVYISSTTKLDTAGRVIIEGSRVSAASTMRIDEFSATLSRSIDISMVDSTKTLPTAMEWEPGTSKLQVINDLLGAINYESATYDENGYFIGKPYVRPQDRSSEFRYATDSESVLTGDVDQTVDLFGVPNKWVVIVSDPDRPTLKGEYTNNNALSPTSTVSRGRIIVDFRTEQNAPDQVTLDAQAERLAFEASQVYEVIEFNTALMPIHQNSDVYDLIIDGLVVDAKYSEHTWSMELANGSTMKHKVRKVVSV